jgi:dCMP deaminase
MSNDWDRRFLSLAAHIAGWSKDPSTKCGAVIVRPNRTIVSLGYNGFPRGLYDDPEMLNNREEKYKRVVHAEMNALLHAGASTEGCTLYTWPFPPCCKCATCVIQMGLTRVVAPGGSGPLWDRHDIALTRGMFKETGVHLHEVDLGWYDPSSGGYRQSVSRDG